MSTAISQGLVFASGRSFTLKADDSNVVSSSSSGRNSVRIQSPNAYNSHVTVYVLLFIHMQNLRHVFTLSLKYQPLPYAKRMRYVARDMGGRSYSLSSDSVALTHLKQVGPSWPFDGEVSLHCSLVRLYSWSTVTRSTSWKVRTLHLPAAPFLIPVLATIRLQ